VYAYITSVPKSDITDVSKVESTVIIYESTIIILTILRKGQRSEGIHYTLPYIIRRQTYLLPREACSQMNEREEETNRIFEEFESYRFSDDVEFRVRPNQRPRSRLMIRRVYLR
jgi:hypothetical protein